MPLWKFARTSSNTMAVTTEEPLKVEAPMALWEYNPNKFELHETTPQVYYIPLGDHHVNSNKGYYPFYIGLDPLMEAIVDDLFETNNVVSAYDDDSETSCVPLAQHEVTAVSTIAQPSNPFLSLPIELLDLIMRLLDPCDLLVLCGTTKYLRELLNSPNASNTWKEVNRIPDVTIARAEETL